jgi:hypothetical protein
MDKSIILVREAHMGQENSQNLAPLPLLALQEAHHRAYPSCLQKTGPTARFIGLLLLCMLARFLVDLGELGGHRRASEACITAQFDSRE